MEFIKTLWKNRKMIFQLGKNDFKNRFAETSLGTVWGFLQPFIMMITYVIVFQFILKTKSSGEYPFMVWYFPGMTMWWFLNDSILNVSNSIRSYSYLVKKVVFPVDTIPVISLMSSGIVSIFLIVIATIVCSFAGYFPNILLLIYYIVATILLIVAITRFTSAICALIPDFSNLLGIVMQLLFWFTPIIWNINMLENMTGGAILQTVVKCMPFTYLITGFRQVFIEGNIIKEANGLYTIVFWLFVLLMFIWGNKVFKKCKKDFADVL